MTAEKINRRRRFVALMSLFSALYGGVFTSRVLQGQADVLSDVVKIAAVIALGAACFGYVFWTVANFKCESKMSGALAGVMTALFTLQFPLFVWLLKRDIPSTISAPDHSLIDAVKNVIVFTFNDFRYTFSKGEGLAILLSAIVGYFIAKGSKRA